LSWIEVERMQHLADGACVGIDKRTFSRHLDGFVHGSRMEYQIHSERLTPKIVPKEFCAWQRLMLAPKRIGIGSSRQE
jgi:hypothetical protein